MKNTKVVFRNYEPSEEGPHAPETILLPRAPPRDMPLFSFLQVVEHSFSSPFLRQPFQWLVQNALN